MTDNVTLQADFDLLAARCKDKQGELATARAELSGLVETLVDAADKERKSLLQKRVELLNLIGACDDELQELIRRRDVARLAIAEFNLQQAQDEYKRVNTLANEKRLALNAALDEQLHFLNRGGRAGIDDENLKKIKYHEITVATTKADSQFAARHKKAAGGEYQKIKADMEALRKELGIHDEK